MVSRVAGGRLTKEGQFLVTRVKVESRQVVCLTFHLRLSIKVTEVEFHCLCSLFPFFRNLSSILETAKDLRAASLGSRNLV